MLAATTVLKNIIINILYYSGLPIFIREFVQKNKVSILVLHDPKAAFASQYFKWLSRHYNVISLDKYLAVRAGKDTTGLPRKPLIITLDDGHIENYKLLALAKEYNVPLTIFLCSGIVDTNRHYWFKFAGIPATTETFKAISDNDRLRVLYQLGFYPEKEFPYPQALNKSQITEMKEYINFQGHTIFHPCLPGCNDQTSMLEIGESKKQLERKFDLSINALAYPNGEYTDREIRYAQQAGYTCAVTLEHGFNDDKTDLFKLRRLSVGDRDNIKLLAIKASGIWSFFKYAASSLLRPKDNSKWKDFLFLNTAVMVNMFT
jgi:peptidoglycan/xylan/chitin deacetylase (PgdA/CDA1 family)